MEAQYLIIGASTYIHMYKPEHSSLPHVPLSEHKDTQCTWHYDLPAAQDLLYCDFRGLIKCSASRSIKTAQNNVYAE